MYIMLLLFEMNITVFIKTVWNINWGQSTCNILPLKCVVDINFKIFNKSYDYTVKLISMSVTYSPENVICTIIILCIYTHLIFYILLPLVGNNDNNINIIHFNYNMLSTLSIILMCVKVYLYH